MHFYSIPSIELTSASVGLRRSGRVSGGGRAGFRRLLLLRRIATAALVSVDREQRKERPEETSHRTVWSWSQSFSKREKTSERRRRTSEIPGSEKMPLNGGASGLASFG